MHVYGTLSFDGSLKVTDSESIKVAHSVSIAVTHNVSREEQVICRAKLLHICKPKTPVCFFSLSRKTYMFYK